MYNKLNDCIAKAPNGGRKRAIQRTSYILHIYVDTTTLFVGNKLVNRKAKINIEHTIVYAQVLDTIKGKTLPNINTGVIAIQQPEASNTEESMSSSLINLTIPANIDLIFNYCSNLWRINNKSDIVFINSDGEIVDALKDWIKPKREYIVELAPNYECCYDGQCYYALWPIGGGYGHGMYPIEDGNVLDIGNVCGWGKSVPLNNLNALLNEIKNYGE